MLMKRNFGPPQNHFFQQDRIYRVRYGKVVITKSNGKKMARIFNEYFVNKVPNLQVNANHDFQLVKQ